MLSWGLGWPGNEPDGDRALQAVAAARDHGVRGLPFFLLLFSLDLFFFLGSVVVSLCGVVQDNFRVALRSVRPSVSAKDIKQHIEFTEEFGHEG